MKEKIDPDYNNAYNANKVLLGALDKIINKTGVVSVNEYISINDNAFDMNLKLYNNYSENLYKLIDKRVHKYSDQIPFTIFFTILTLVVIGYFFAGFYISMMKAIRLVEETSIKVADGDLRVNIQLESNDEVADLAKTLNTIFDSLRKTVTSLITVAKDINEGSQTMTEAAEQTAIGSEQTAKGACYLAQGANEISVSVEQGAANINKLDSSIKEITKEAANVATFGDAAEVQASEGSQLVQNAIEKIDNIKNVAGDISVAISELGRLSKEIEQIVDLIKNIAGQTNLLALNAAIEAARAGEHGKGFAVVADEVKKLAGQSADATDKITSMIKEIQNKTQIAVETVDKATQRVEDGVLVINDVGKSLENIISQVKAANNKIQGITKEIEGVAVGSDDIVKMLDNITSIIDQTAASSEELSSITEQQTANLEEISASSQVLKNIANDLDNKVSVFKI